MNSNLFLKSGHLEAGIHPSGHQDSFPKILPCKATMGNSTLAIATFGYQILRCPQFAELCWVTSKLREGPSTDINGPWKGWPFNSCVMHGNASPETVSVGGNSGIQRDNSGAVRGLTAVGLLSYRGVYTSVRDVASEVRKVLELLVGQVRAKILVRKDRCQYLRILSQVAYLEDIVNIWAYKFQSSHTNNPIPESYTKPVFAGRLSTENNSSGSNQAGNQSCLLSFLSKSCTEAEETLLEGSYAKSNTSNGQCIDLSKGLSNNSLPKSDMCKIPETEHLQEDVPSAPLSSSVHSSPSLATTLVGGDLSCRTEGPELNKSLDSLKQFNGLEMTKDSLAFDGPNSSANATKFSSKEIDLCSNGLDTVLLSKDAELVSKEPCKVPEITLGMNGNILAALKTSYLYNCCSGCLHALYVLARDILSECWESNGHCSTVEDIDNVVSSCSLNLLATFRKFNVSESGNNTAEYCHRTPSEHCACQEVGNKHLKQMSYQNKASENMFLAAGDCNCHLRDECNATVHTESDVPFHQSLTYFFRDGVLVSSKPQKDEALHCRYNKFCLCSMVEMILSVKKPMD